MAGDVDLVLQEIFGANGVTDGCPLLTIQGVSVYFGGIAALNDVNGEVLGGQVAAVVGPNGAGKTTLLNAISGLTGSRRVTGRIEMRGRNIAGWPAARISGAGIGRSFQDPRMIEKLSVVENVLCGAHRQLGYSGIDQLIRRRRVVRQEKFNREKALSLLKFVGLGKSADSSSSSLPYGARKVVDIARAMMSGPALLLLDEPTSGLDLGEREAVQGLLSHLRSGRWVSILLVEHHMDLVRQVADHVVGMQAGGVLAAGSPTDVLDSPSYRDALVGNQPS